MSMTDLGMLRYQTVTITESTDTSSVADMLGYTVCGIEMPASMTGGTITFLAGGSPTELIALRSVADNVVAVGTAGGARRVGLVYDNFLGARYVSIKSESAESATVSLTLVGFKP